MKRTPSQVLVIVSLCILTLAASACGGRPGRSNSLVQGLIEGLTVGDATGPADPVRFESHDTEGRILTARLTSKGGARVALVRVRAALAERLGGPVTLVSVYGSRDDDELHSAFTHGGAGVRGLIMISGKGEDGTLVEVLMDRAGRAARSLGELATRLPGRVASPPAPLPMQQVWIPDGSGSLQIPQGWIVQGQRGMVDVTGPDGQACSFGIHFQVFTPEAAAEQRQMMMQLGMAPAMVNQNMPLCAPYRGPVQAFLDVTPQILRKSGGDMTELRVIKSKEMRDAAGPSAQILAEGILNQGGRQYPVRSLIHVYTNPIGAGQWSYYFSAVSAPTKIFDRDVSTMVDCWNSFRASGQEYQRRHDSAMETMRETFAIQRSATRAASESRDRNHAAMGHVLRGTWPVDDIKENRRHDAWTSDPKAVVEALNAGEVYERWRVVPISDL